MTLATELTAGPKNYSVFEHYFIFTFLCQQASTKEFSSGNWLQNSNLCH